MNAVLRILFAPFEPFVNHPERASLVAALFGILFAVSLARSRAFHARHHLAPLVAAFAWLLVGLNEQRAMANGWNIRVDLLVSWPIVLAISIWAAWTGLRGRAGRTAEGKEHGDVVK